MRLARLRQLSAAEITWRAREFARTTTDRVRARVALPRWENSDQMEPIAASIIERLCTQPSRFGIDPSRATEVRDDVLARWPDAARDAAARADRIIGGQYDLLGYRGLDFKSGGSIDWHLDPVHHRRAPKVCWADVPYLDPAIGDHKIIWELNRHQHWMQLGRAWWLTGDAKYADAIVRQCESWMAANPPLTGINWASMLEIGFRTLSWTAALHFLSASGSQRAAGSKEQDILSAGGLLSAARFLSAIARQLTHLEHHLSYTFSPNTHLTGEALALYVVGHAFPELPASERWVATGRRILVDEIDRQILPDGGHVERSTHYQRYTLDFYLLALLTARRAGDADGERTFRPIVLRLADFTRAIADDDGCLPLIGDDDGGMLWPVMGRACADVRDSLAIAACVLDRPELAPWGIPEEAFWIAQAEVLNGEPPIRDPLSPIPVSTTFPDTGYVVLRSSGGDHAIFDTGVHGYMNGGHAHADALALTLSVGGRPFLVDPGTSTYTMDARLRDRIRSSFSHNTLAIDGRPQSVPAGPFHWRSSAMGRHHASRHNAGFDWVEGAHDGYAPLEHRRAIVRADDAGWLIVDAIPNPESRIPNPGRDPHHVSTYWHFHPNWMLRDEQRGHLRATHLEGGNAWLLFDDGELLLRHGNDEAGLGWFAPVYGTLIPTWSAQITRTAPLPTAMVTWISGRGLAHAPVLERIDVASDSARLPVAARIVAGAFASTYLVHLREPAACDGRASGVGGYQTNARVLHVRRRDERLVALDLADASHALSLHDAGISVIASEPTADLHVSVDDGMLVLAASEPPGLLRLEGRALTAIRAVFLNGRSFLPPPIDHPDTILVPGGAWGDHAGAPPVRVLRPTLCA